MHLSALDRPPPSQPWRRVFLGENGQEVAANASNESDWEDENSSRDKGRARADDDNSANNSTDSEGDADSEQAKFDALLEELSNSEYPSSDHESLGRQDNDPAQPQKARRRAQNTELRQRKYETLLSTVAILYVACCIMRIPVTSMDFIRYAQHPNIPDIFTDALLSRLIDSYHLPYLDTSLLIPAEIVKYLSTEKMKLVQRPVSHDRSSLGPRVHLMLQFAPTTMELYECAQRIVRTSRHLHGVAIPESNAAPLLWRAVRGMLGSRK